MFQQYSDFLRWAGTNLDATAFASKIPTLTKPVASATAAVLDLVSALPAGALTPKEMKLVFILLGASNDVASFRLIGWNKVKSGNLPPLWMPQPFAELVCTAGAATGVTGSPVLVTELFVDTIAPVALMLEDQKIAAGTSVMSEIKFFTPGNDTIAHIVIPFPAFELLEFTLDQTTNTPTGNILYSFLR